jgi:hypothetical protein
MQLEMGIEFISIAATSMSLPDLEKIVVEAGEAHALFFCHQS